MFLNYGYLSGFIMYLLGCIPCWAQGYKNMPAPFSWWHVIEGVQTRVV